MLEAKSITYKCAYTELNAIFKFLPSDELKKIPAKIRKNIKEEMNAEYEFRLDLNKPLIEQNLMNETKALIIEIYERFLCDEEEKEQWKVYDNFCFNKIEERKKNQYAVENIFETRQEENTPNELALTEIPKIGFFKRIINKIKSFFKLNVA